MGTLIGQSLGRYHIIEQLGEGGMATVYKAYDTRLERDVAVKIIRVDQFAPAVLEHILKRFEREAKALAKLSHPNILKIHDFGEYEGTPYLVMEYLPGGTLKARLGKSMPWQEAVKLLLPVAEALEYAHSQGIVHRDVKPSNILLTQDGQPMLTDFGIAKLLESDETHTLTGTGVGVGTPEYMAPEQVDARTVDGRADIYSLGIVMFEMITGRKPYIADTPLAVMIKQVHDPLPRPKSFIPGLPDAVEKVLFKALAKKPEDRYEGMNGMVQELERLDAASMQSVEEKGKKKGTISEKDKEEQKTTKEREIREGTFERKRGMKRKWMPWTLGSGALVVLLFIGGALIWGEDLGATLFFTKISTTIFSSTLGIGSTMVREADDMEMVYVPEGKFTMGSTEGDLDEQPVQEVYLDAYWIDKTEVTNKMYALCVSAGMCNAPANSDSRTRKIYYGTSTYFNYPVVYVNWFDARGYCEWVGGRLPTEAEWEKAARGTDGRTYPWGESAPTCLLVNYLGCVEDTAKVGSSIAGVSPYGVLDMAGNVWEWVADLYDIYPGGAVTASDYFGLTLRVLRGGNFGDIEPNIRSSRRLPIDPTWSDHDVGFRCASSP